MSNEHRMNAAEHLWIGDLRKFPRGEVRLYAEHGRLISGTYPYQVTDSITEMLAQAWDEGYRAGQSFEAARHDRPAPRRALTVVNPYRVASPREAEQ